MSFASRALKYARPGGPSILQRYRQSGTSTTQQRPPIATPTLQQPTSAHISTYSVTPHFTARHWNTLGGALLCLAALTGCSEERPYYGEPRKTMPADEVVVALNPLKVAWSHNQKGSAYLRAGRYTEAATAYRAAWMHIAEHRGELGAPNAQYQFEQTIHGQEPTLFASNALLEAYTWMAASQHASHPRSFTKRAELGLARALQTYSATWDHRQEYNSYQSMVMLHTFLKQQQRGFTGQELAHHYARALYAAQQTHARGAVIRYEADFFGNRQDRERSKLAIRAVYDHLLLPHLSDDSDMGLMGSALAPFLTASNTMVERGWFHYDAFPEIRANIQRAKEAEQARKAAQGSPK